MQTKRKLLFVTRDQFGYHIDSYEYAKNLKSLYDITFFCWDYGLPRVEIEGINTMYISRKGNMIYRNLNFRFRLLKTLRNKYEHIFILYFFGVSLVHFIAPQQSLICDVRTGDVDAYRIRRMFFNAIMSLELSTFRNKTIISDCLAKRLHLRNYRVLPLGGNLIPVDKKDYTNFKLLYVGILNGRRIDETVRGFGEFYNENKDHLNCRYDIVGAGRPAEIEKIKTAIADYNLQNIVKLHGYIQHEQLTSFFQQSNIGISYIPMTDFFDCQPPTKTYEYLLGGLAVLATKTMENMRIVNDDNGILIQDNAESVTTGLTMLYKNRAKYNAITIQKSMEPFDWKNIAVSNLNLFLESLQPKNSNIN